MEMQQQRKTLTVEGPTERFEIDISDGSIVPSQAKAYYFYERANVSEYLAWAAVHGVSLDRRVPILAIGLYTRNSYHEPAEFWREQWLHQMGEERQAA